jgi:hypothetical protein
MYLSAEHSLRPPAGDQLIRQMRGSLPDNSCLAATATYMWAVSFRSYSGVKGKTRTGGCSPLHGPPYRWFVISRAVFLCKMLLEDGKDLKVVRLEAKR